MEGLKRDCIARVEPAEQILREPRAFCSKMCQVEKRFSNYLCSIGGEFRFEATVEALGSCKWSGIYQVAQT